MNSSIKDKADDLVVGSHGPCEIKLTDVCSERLVEKSFLNDLFDI